MDAGKRQTRAMGVKLLSDGGSRKADDSHGGKMINGVACRKIRVRSSMSGHDVLHRTMKAG